MKNKKIKSILVLVAVLILLSSGGFGGFWITKKFFSGKTLVQNKVEITELETKQVASGLKLAQIIKEVGFAPSTSQALKLIQGQAVSIDGVRVVENIETLPESFVLKVGKLKICKISIETPELGLGM